MWLPLRGISYTSIFGRGKAIFGSLPTTAKPQAPKAHLERCWCHTQRSQEGSHLFLIYDVLLNWGGKNKEKKKRKGKQPLSTKL